MCLFNGKGSGPKLLKALGNFLGEGRFVVFHESGILPINPALAYR